MKLPRRNFLHLAACAAALPAVSHVARAQAYPARPVRWIVGFTPGGGNDITARLMGQWLTERLGQPFIIENRPGAGTNIAAELVVNAAPDGYTLFFANVANAVNATLYEKLNFDFIRDITPVAGIMRVPNIMAVRALQRLERGETQADIARSYNVDPTTIGRLLGGRPFPGGASLAGLQ
jgi:tripartite-type tricarboxylate transporter receptor subunit TctC